jgi:hypothetical protein
LLGSLSPSSGGGKKVNRGVATVEQGIKSGDITLKFEFPCASTITVIVYTNMNSTRLGVVQGNTYADSEFLGQFMSLSFSPQEDDTYIYEIVIE